MCLSMFFHVFAWLHFYGIVPAQLREYKTELDLSLPASLDMVGRWLLRAEGALAEEEGDPQDHARAAEEAREKLDLLKVISHNLHH